MLQLNDVHAYYGKSHVLHGVNVGQFQHVSTARPPEGTDAPPRGAANEVSLGFVSFQCPAAACASASTEPRYASCTRGLPRTASGTSKAITSP